MYLQKNQLTSCCFCISFITISNFEVIFVASSRAVFWVIEIVSFLKAFGLEPFQHGSAQLEKFHLELIIFIYLTPHAHVCRVCNKSNVKKSRWQLVFFFEG